MYDQAQQISQIIAAAQKVVIIQADNPDADSLGSALALESILGNMGKEPILYCGVDMPAYLRYLSGWDRVQPDIPQQFDASIIVDASTMTLLEKLTESGQQGWVAAKPCIVLDHHAKVDNLVPFAEVMIIDGQRASAGELIYRLSQQLDWPLPIDAQAFIMSSILGDTQGLTNQLASAETYRVMAELVEHGVSRPKLEELRRDFSKMPAEILTYKGRLLQRAEFTLDGQMVSVTIPQDEINAFSPLYNPGPLVQADMLQTLGVKIAIVFKHYDDGKITAAIRCNNGWPMAGQIAETMGGGGHAYAAGFKIVNGKPFNEVKSECTRLAFELLAKLESEKAEENHETVQYAYQTT